VLIGGLDSGVQCCHMLLLLLSTPLVTGVIDMATERGQNLVVVGSKENTKFVFRSPFKLFVQIISQGASNVPSIASLFVEIEVEVGLFAAGGSVFRLVSVYIT